MFKFPLSWAWKDAGLATNLTAAYLDKNGSPPFSLVDTRHHCDKQACPRVVNWLLASSQLQFLLTHEVFFEAYQSMQESASFYQIFVSFMPKLIRKKTQTETALVIDQWVMGDRISLKLLQ